MKATIRAYEFGDEAGINNVIRTVFEEYGWKWDPATENRDTHDIENYYIKKGGKFWVLVSADEIIGSVAITPNSESRCSLKRLYLLPTHRGNGYGRLMFKKAIEEATSQGYTEMEIWSDKTLDVSHVMYKNAGSTSLGERRVLDEDYGVPYEEFGYLLSIGPKEPHTSSA